MNFVCMFEISKFKSIENSLFFVSLKKKLPKMFKDLKTTEFCLAHYLLL